MNLSHVGDLILGKSQAMSDLRDQVCRAARMAAPVLIQGPTGAGKELVARGLHAESKRNGRFVDCNVAAIPEALFESELLGHVRGAFTGAASARLGLVRRANHGTLFLDEIGDLQIAVQLKLLRVLETREVSPLGADFCEAIDFRLVAATNVNLDEAERHGRFRTEFLYRLRGIVIHVPPLCDHREDIEHLAAHFAASLTVGLPGAVHLTAKAIRALECHEWPGNVRELQHTIEFSAFLSDTEEITEIHVKRALETFQGNCEVRTGSLEASHRMQLLTLLSQFEGDVNAVAQSLGVTRSTAYRRMHSLGIGVSRRGPRLRPIPNGRVVDRIDRN